MIFSIRRGKPKTDQVLYKVKQDTMARLSNVVTQSVYTLVDFNFNRDVTMCTKSGDFHYFNKDVNGYVQYDTLDSACAVLDTLNPSEVPLGNMTLKYHGLIDYQYDEPLCSYMLRTTTLASEFNLNPRLAYTNFIEYMQLYCRLKNMSSTVKSIQGNKPKNWNSTEYDMFLEGYIPLAIINKSVDTSGVDGKLYNDIQTAILGTPLTEGHEEIPCFDIGGKKCPEGTVMIWVTRLSAYKFLSVNPKLLEEQGLEAITTVNVLTNLLRYAGLLDEATLDARLNHISNCTTRDQYEFNMYIDEFDINRVGEVNQ